MTDTPDLKPDRLDALAERSAVEMRRRVARKCRNDAVWFYQTLAPRAGAGCVAAAEQFEADADALAATLTERGQR